MSGMCKNCTTHSTKTLNSRMGKKQIKHLLNDMDDIVAFDVMDVKRIMRETNIPVFIILEKQFSLSFGDIHRRGLTAEETSRLKRIMRAYA